MDAVLPSEAAQTMLQFSCPGCGMDLAVSAEFAGTDGPCPGCGATIMAPMPEVAPGKSCEVSPAGEAAPAAPAVAAREVAPTSVPSPNQEKRRRVRTVVSHPDLMHPHGGGREVQKMLKIAIAFLVTMGLVFLVHGFLKREVLRGDLPGDFEEELTF